MTRFPVAFAMRARVNPTSAEEAATMHTDHHANQMFDRPAICCALAGLLLVGVLSACGGGNSDPCGLATTCNSTGSGTPPPAAAPVVASYLILQLSGPTLQNNGSNTVTATVSY